jgi:hypothetical protein
VIQVLGGNTRKMSRDALRGHIDRIAESWGTSQPFYLDFIRERPERMLQYRNQPRCVADLAYMYATRRQLQFIPVTWTTSRAAHLNSAANAAVAVGRGIAIRHRILGTAGLAGRTSAEALRDTATATRLPPTDIDIWLDLTYLDEDVEITARRLTRMVERVEAAEAWRRIVITGSSMPSTLGCVPEDGTEVLPRREWRLWTALPSDLRKRVVFGDYGIQHPTPPQSGGPGMRANIRYTVADGHLVVRGRGDVRVEGARQYVDLCNRLLHSGRFSGTDYTWGDELIDACARGTIQPGDQTMWRAAGTAHHLRFVTEQLQQTS